MWSHIWLSVKHIFNHIHMRTLGNIRLPEADPTLMIMFLDFLERSISELLPVGIGNAICDYPYLRELASEHWSEHPWARPGWQCTRVQVSCIPKPVSISHIPHPSIDPRLVGPESPLLQERNLKTLHLKPSTQGSRRIRRETLLTFLTIVDTTNKLAVALVTTLTASTQRDWACAFSPVKIPPEITHFHSRIKLLCYGWLACDFSYWHVYSEVWSCNFPLLNIFFSGDIEGLAPDWKQMGLVSLFGLWNEVFQTGIIPESFFHL